MVKTIEHEYEPDFVSPPGETLQDILDDIGMSQAELARRMGRPNKTINEIIKAETAILPRTALQLEKVLNIPASFWNNREKKYREYLAKKEEKKLLMQDVEWTRNFPINEMVKFGWIKRFIDKVTQFDEILKFFGVANIKQWGEIWNFEHIHFRKSSLNTEKFYLLSAWLRQGELLAREIGCSAYNQSLFLKNLYEIRHLTNEQPEKFITEIQNLCAQSGVAFVLVPELSRSGVWGATRWLSSTRALIQLSLRYKTNDHLWFTFFHEAGHIVKHGKKTPFIESDNYTDELEKEADEFAKDILIPEERYQKFINHGRLSGLRIRRFANEIGIHPGIVVGRLQHDKLVPFRNFNKLKIKYTWRIT